jgi:fermentation-respiration switch protein FrsA (DUF1100 family)
VVRVVAVVGVLAIALLASAWLLQRRLIYLPSGGIPAPLPGAQPVRFTTVDGVELAGWFVPPAGGDGPAGAVLVCNGNAGNRAARAPLAAALSDRGLGVLLFDYRGFGGQAGSPSESGLLADARAARDVLAARAEVDPERLVYFGESLGAGVATALAAERPPAALVLRSPFPSLAAVGRLHYPFLPVAPLLRDRYPVARQVARYEGPLLVIAGAQDEIVPPELSRQVADAAAGPTHFVLLEGNHNDRALLDGEPLLTELGDFLRQAGVLTEGRRSR